MIGCEFLNTINERLQKIYAHQLRKTDIDPRFGGKSFILVGDIK